MASPSFRAIPACVVLFWSLETAEALMVKDSIQLVADVSANATLQAPQVAEVSPFGREDTARALQQHASRTQDTLVDAVENAEVSEIKRAVFRALTRLRAAEIKEFDTIARLQTQAIDEFNDKHSYRAENPIDHLHDSEPKVSEDKYSAFH
eukprot:TRINITY_DN46480_c0_g1_i1.p1 TRINITY_DN46480_c0_g1~~TRINITY_DN46480_c0_g1_i1.p1  ORF type:complete len:151 (+),score=27.30 TRINITY_DN46480_c0_g1_i1:103-555(+)